MKKILFGNLIFLLSIIYISSCDNDPLLTELNTSRLKIVLKGTYASHGTTSGWEIPASYNSTIVDDSVDDKTNPPDDVYPDTFMIDIAEIKLDKDRISNYRQTFSIDFDIMGGVDTHPFFDGTGIVLKTDDPKPDKNYKYVRIYIRKLIFNNAQEYYPTGTGWGTAVPAEVVFAEDDVYGFDFNQRMPHNHWDILREEEDDINRVFPLKVPIVGGFVYDPNDEETVLEIRILIKNFIKLYEYDEYDDDEYFVTHYFGVSDWVHEMRAGEDDLGGNLIGVARAYVPGKVGTVNIQSGLDGTLGSDEPEYVILVPESADVNNFLLNDNGTGLRSLVDCDMPIPPDSDDLDSYVEQYLDYYLEYEEYKVNWNDSLTNCSTEASSNGRTELEEYESDWDDYIDEYEDYSLPPIVCYKADGATSAVIENVPPGNYYIYKTDSIPAFGELFTGAFTQGNSNSVFTVTAGETVSFDF